MAHLIANVNGKDSFAHVGKAAWHELGQQLQRGASLETWAREAGFEWSALAAVPMFTRQDGTLGAMDDKRIIYRSDTGAPLAAVGSGYKIVQPSQVLEFFRDVVASEDWELNTAGALDEGRKFWAMASPRGAHDDAIGDDRLTMNLLLATSLDGTMRTHACMTTVRVVCDNTLGFALDDVKRNKRAKVSVSHRSDFDAQAIKDALGIAAPSFGQFMAHARKLAAVHLADDEAREILRDLIGRPAKLPEIEAPATAGASDFARLIAGSPLPAIPAAKAPRDHRNVTRVMELWQGAGYGADMASAKGTAWGLLNAVTQFVDHEATRNADARVVNGFFGKGADLKDATFAELLKRA